VNGAEETTATAPEWRSAMIDVSALSLAELVATARDTPAADTALGRSLRRLTDELDHPGEPIAGFNSAL
jgi:FXSXX-COOH protein